MRLFLLFAFLLFAQFSFSQSSITYNSQELTTLSKVWGLMKYYHPAVSQGKIDWDQAFLNSLQAPDKKTVAATVQEWLTLADKTVYENIKENPLECDSISLRNFDPSWITNSTLLSASERAELNKLVNRPQNIGSYWCGKDDKIYYKTDNEKVYKNDGISYRLLNLSRIWNVIEYYYPYKYLLTKKWHTVLPLYVPQFIAATDTIAYAKVLTRLSAEINDSHVTISPTYNYEVFGAYTAPFKFQIVDRSVIVTKLVDAAACKAANIEVNDLITEIAGKSITYNVDKNKQYMPASNIAVTNREAFNYIFSGRDSSINVRVVKQGGKSFITDLKRIKRIFLTEWDKDGKPDLRFKYNGSDYRLTGYDVKKSRPIGRGIHGNIGYIYLELLPSDEIDSVMVAMKNTKGIVIDLRGYNDGGAIRIFNHLLPKPAFFGIKTQPIFSAPGKFCYADNLIQKEYKYIGKDNPDYYKGKVVCLIDENTQSAEEMYAMIFKSIPNVTFVGSQTAGADGNKCHITFTNGREMEFSGLGIYYPNGRETQRIGIVPDIVIRPTIKSIRDNQDILVEKAFDIINGN